MLQIPSIKLANRAEKSERTTVFSPETIAEEVSKLLLKVGGGRPGKVTTNTAADRVSEFLKEAISASRIYDIWRGESLPKAFEMDAIRAAAGIIQEGRDEFAALNSRIARLEAALLVPDEESYRAGADELRQGRRSSDRALG